ncbi:MAG: fumarate reductase/succinate dehydrogenase flavoprotein subunit [Planctomycetaceae bacterium]|jgi:succinate dehydrogenase / fumarate reductase flavoprotein subunit|nr:fumarate reductase/succinate dehydrogenase flavoprotein subunit [Planctomycetaceae bacterium]MCP4777621.1 fumarate reductase/succinate dehydrogenase flavoprotein subunit [Planctomycetaceae bacterium]
MLKLDSKIPVSPIEDAWTFHKNNNLRLVGPKNRPKYKVIVVGSGLAGASAAASMGAMGYNVECFCFQDSPRRAHSIAAQGGINASKNYRNDGDSTWRLFYDTQKGGDYRAREQNVYRLAELSTSIIDQAVSQGVPFAREYGGKLANRSFGGVLVERTFYCRGETGQQLLLGAYSALEEQIAAKKVKMHTRHEMLDLVVVDGRSRGIVVRNLETGEITSHAADAVVLATGGYGNVFYLSTNAKGCNVTANFRAYRKGAGFANPCFTQIHPTSIPASGDYQSKLTLMSESLRNDGRIWVPRDADEKRAPKDIPEKDRYYYLEERYPRFGNLVPRDVAARNAKDVCDQGLGVGPTGYGVYLDFAAAIEEKGIDAVKSKYANLFEMYQRITDDDPVETPMRIYPAVHYTMGGLWVDYNLMTNVPGLYAIGESNFADHGANRLGASSLMQCLADGYFIIPVTIGDFLSRHESGDITTDHPAFKETETAVKERVNKLLAVNGTRSAQSFHRELGKIMWEHCGISRNKESLEEGLRKIPALREEFWRDLKLPGNPAELNQSLEHAGRVLDFLDFGELMCRDALLRDESCGCHFREEHQTPEGEAERNDEDYAFVSVFEYKGEGTEPELNKEPLSFDALPLAARNYKT